MIVLVHGNPETAVIWRKTRDRIGRESVALSLPGFGCPRPDGFDATKDHYVRWLVGELEELDEPIDLVGHDWGALLTYRLASTRGDLLRSWVADVGQAAHPRYDWHPFAKIWQTPGEGEAFVEAQSALTPEEQASVFVGMGVPHDDALEMATATDPTMGGCILDLYRSAMPNVHHDWGPWAPTSAPGLVLAPTEDALGDEDQAAEVATSLGARFERLVGVGHFWPYEGPDAAASVMESFWASLE